jgi:hypothetical protein
MFWLAGLFSKSFFRTEIGYLRESQRHNILRFERKINGPFSKLGLIIPYCVFLMTWRALFQLVVSSAQLPFSESVLASISQKSAN